MSPPPQRDTQPTTSLFIPHRRLIRFAHLLLMRMRQQSSSVQLRQLRCRVSDQSTLLRSYVCYHLLQLSTVSSIQCLTWLVKRVAVMLAPVLSLMCNVSLRCGQFPDSHKHAVIFPRLKKPSFDSDDPNSYRPISNLSFISKLVERVVARGFVDHTEHNKLFRSSSLPTDNSTVHSLPSGAS